ncbi:MAG: glycosyltransferase [Desulfobulbaceae bacterium]|nr:glycosyltransferase [Desulfobulbaceae bacterium]
MASLSISIVTYRQEAGPLQECLGSLGSALDYARQQGSIQDASLTVIDNSTDTRIHDALGKLLATAWQATETVPQLLQMQSNLGYGKAHNIAIRASTMDYHLVLNPDVVLDREALHHALGFMQAHEHTVLLTPSVNNADGDREYLNKDYPDVTTLLLRGFAPAFIKKHFTARIARYELRDLDPQQIRHDIPLASGCFMFCKTATLQQVSGFRDCYFLYFEDYDLSMRLHALGEIAYTPDVRIVHYGGNAAKKGSRHIGLFVRSAVTFFNQHGWKLW